MTDHAWRLSDLPTIDAAAPTVFSCFHCGGGSTMGYKLAGYRVLGGVEIDPRMVAIYRANHRPALSFLMGVQDFAKMADHEIPDALRTLDVLDGSPPCSSFSTSGSRDKKWGKSSKFREGQADQVLDTLFFDFIEVARRLRPKVVIAENVKGLMIGKARGYVKQIAAAYDRAGYDVQLFLLNAASMGVPQARERTFFVARRRDLELPPISLRFNFPPITAAQATAGAQQDGKALTLFAARYWHRMGPNEKMSKYHPSSNGFTRIRLDPNRPAPTVTASSGGDLYHWQEPRNLSREEVVRLQTFPDDYDFGKEKPHYVCGMSVPPRMMQRVAEQVRLQWLSKIDAQ